MLQFIAFFFDTNSRLPWASLASPSCFYVFSTPWGSSFCQKDSTSFGFWFHGFLFFRSFSFGSPMIPSCKTVNVIQGYSDWTLFILSTTCRNLSNIFCTLFILSTTWWNLSNIFCSPFVLFTTCWNLSNIFCTPFIFPPTCWGLSKTHFFIRYPSPCSFICYLSWSSYSYCWSPLWLW